MNNCYATGSVTNRIDTYEGYCYVGGLIGVHYQASLTNCYVTNSYVTGVLIAERPGSLIYCGYVISEFYADTVTKNLHVAKNDEDMKYLQSESFLTSTFGWSSDVWNFVEGEHPTLKNAGLLR